MKQWSNRFVIVACLGLVWGSVWGSSRVLAEGRSKAHQEYAAKLWEFLHRPGQPFTAWRQGKLVGLVAGPHLNGSMVIFMNGLASRDMNAPGATVVAKHGDADEALGMTVWYRVDSSYRGADDGWYWVHYLPDGSVIKTSADKNPYDKRGFMATVDDGRLWVFKIGTPELLEFKKTGEPAKHVTRPGAGPGGMTIKGADTDTITEYLTQRAGFVTRVSDGRLWVFRDNSEDLAAFDAGKINEKHVTRPGAGPDGMTIKAVTSADIDDYRVAKPHFVTRVVDGRVWIFKPGSEELNEFDTQGELAKHVTWPAAGPNNITLKGADEETLQAYVAAKPGFATIIEDGRIWVFREGSDGLAEFEKSGEPAKCVTRPGAGPLGMTIKSVDAETIAAYLAAN